MKSFFKQLENKFFWVVVSHDELQRLKANKVVIRCIRLAGKDSAGKPLYRIPKHLDFIRTVKLNGKTITQLVEVRVKP